MRVFVTGATGWVGSVVVDELLGAGHQVLGLSRSEEKATVLAAKGAAVLHGALDDLDLLAAAAGNADAVIHLAFNHDFSKYAENSEQDRRAIEAMGEAMVGTDKPILVTRSGNARPWRHVRRSSGARLAVQFPFHMTTEMRSVTVRSIDFGHVGGCGCRRARQHPVERSLCRRRCVS